MLWEDITNNLESLLEQPSIVHLKPIQRTAIIRGSL